MPQTTIFGSKAIPNTQKVTNTETVDRFISNNKQSEPSHDFGSTQIKVGDSKEAMLQRKEEEKKCPNCNQVKPKFFDICPHESNADICIDCIRARHKKHGMKDTGFWIDGDTVRFYSHTTGIEQRKLDEIFRVCFGTCFSNPVFPYNLNCADPKYESNCFGITKEFGDWLIANIEWTKTKTAKDSIDYDAEDGIPESQIVTWERAKPKSGGKQNGGQ